MMTEEQAGELLASGVPIRGGWIIIGDSRVVGVARVTTRDRRRARRELRRRANGTEFYLGNVEAARALRRQARNG